MNFFKSVFSNEPTPPDSPKSPSDSQTFNPDSTSIPAWSFGGLIETYRKDFQELGSGLRKETAVIREVASRAVKDLPASLEVGASVAQESLETLGQAIDDIGASVWKSTAQIITHGRDSILSPDHDDSNSSDKQQSLSLKRYSRFDMQVRAIQCDLNTYCTEPEDKLDYDNWRFGSFALEDKTEEIDSLFSENGVIKEIYNEVVPSRVDNQGFWSRYFYKLHKLKQAEEARALLVHKAISGEEEDLTWDFDDEDKEEEQSNGCLPQGQSSGNIKQENNDKMAMSAEVKKGDNSESCKDSDVSVVSSQSLLLEEEDLGWDEIEDIGINDESKVGIMTSTSRLDLQKRLSAAEEEEDLSWDIEDGDDDPDWWNAFVEQMKQSNNLEVVIQASFLCWNLGKLRNNWCFRREIPHPDKAIASTKHQFSEFSSVWHVSKLKSRPSVIPMQCFNFGFHQQKNFLRSTLMQALIP